MEERRQVRRKKGERKEQGIKEREEKRMEGGSDEWTKDR